MLRKTVCLLLAVMMLALSGCAAHMHDVGSGATGSSSEQQRQWYVLWGLVPINTVDTKALAGGSSDYEIKTEHSALDVIINIFTGLITVNSRTVTVTK